MCIRDRGEDVIAKSVIKGVSFLSFFFICCFVVVVFNLQGFGFQSDFAVVCTACVSCLDGRELCSLRLNIVVYDWK